MKTKCPYCGDTTESVGDISGCSVWSDIKALCGNTDWQIEDRCEGAAWVQVTFEDTHENVDFEGEVLGLCLDAYDQWLSKTPKETSLKCNCGANLEIGTGPEMCVRCPACEKTKSKERFGEIRYHSKLCSVQLTDECDELEKLIPREIWQQVVAWLYREVRKVEKADIGEPEAGWSFM